MRYSNPLHNMEQQPTREMLEGWLRENKAEAQKAWAEVERLREALRQIMYAPIDTAPAEMARMASDAFNANGNVDGNALKHAEKPVEDSSVDCEG
jgi:hypothetical protein